MRFRINALKSHEQSVTQGLELGTRIHVVSDFAEALRLKTLGCI